MDAQIPFEIKQKLMRLGDHITIDMVIVAINCHY